MDLRTRNQFPTLNTHTLRDYLSGDGQASARARGELYRQFGPAIRTVVSSELGRRYGALASDIVQEAWARCLLELRARREEFLKQRGERPSVGALMATFTMRSIWALEQRERRRSARLVSSYMPDVTEAFCETSSAPAGSDAEPSLLELHSLLNHTWEQLLSQSSPEQRDLLQTMGPVAFFAGEWQRATETESDPIVTLVLERRKLARALLAQRLEGAEGLSPSHKARFLKAVFPRRDSPREP